MANKFDTRQSINRTALPMVGSIASEGLDSILSKVDPELSKLFEDRNALLVDGGIITYIGTEVQFTEPLRFHLNSKVAGGSPTVIDLGSTTRYVSANNRMIYAVIDRIAGTALVTDEATTLPAVTSTDQEVFLIAKRVDAGDGTKRLYFRNGMALNEGQTVRLGAAGTGGGIGTGDDLNVLTFRASFNDIFEEGPSGLTTAVDSTRTNATYSAAKSLYRLEYDATKTVTGVGTAMTIASGLPAFTAAGDMLIVAGVARRITAISLPNDLTIEAAFPSDPVAAACTVSQAVHTKDIRAHNENSTGRTIASLIPENVQEYLLKYSDSSALNDDIPDFPGAVLAAYTASADNTNWTDVKTRTTALSSSEPVQATPTEGSQFKLRFFAAATSGSGAVNLIDYKVFLHQEEPQLSGEALDQAYGFLDGTGTEINSSLSLVAGKTRITLTWNYPVNINTGKTNGSISVYINGQKIPRYIDAILTPNGYYKEITSNVIELDQDYSSFNLSYEVVRSKPIIDSADENSTKLAALENLFAALDDKVAVVARPTIAAPNTTITGRAKMADLANDLKPRLGTERILIHQLSPELPNESGPGRNNMVKKVFGDHEDKIRFVGAWYSSDQNVNVDNYGNFAYTTSQDSFVEVTFWGTGLTLLTHINATTTRDIRVTVDGGVEGANIYPTTGGGTLNNWRRAVVQPLNLARNLTEGLHTIKIRNAAASSDLFVYGFDIHNESANIKVNPGVALSGSKTILIPTQQQTAPGSSFEDIIKDGISSTSIGTKGAHVIVGLKPNATVAKYAVATDTVTKTLSNTDHSNEELVRTIYPKEFGRGYPGDDFLNMDPAVDYNRHEILEDNSTSLKIDTMRFEFFAGASGAGEGDFLISSGAGNKYITIQFVGTGLDLVVSARSADVTVPASFYEVIIDGGTAQYVTSTIGAAPKRDILKIVSGLPYGTHVVRFGNLNGRPQDVGILNAKIYAPKKPVLPAGVVELGEYFLVADTVDNTLYGINNVTTGTIRRGTLKDWYFIEGTGGTTNWTQDFTPTQYTAGRRHYTDRNGAKAVTTFVGTGFDLRFLVNTSSSNNIQIRLNGLNATPLNFGTMTATWYGGNFNVFTGILDQSTNPFAFGSGLIIKNLPFAVYTLEVINNTTSEINIDCIDIITPIHFPDKQTGFVMNGHLDIGMQSMKDRRKFKLRTDEEVWGKTVYSYKTETDTTTNSTTMRPTFFRNTINVEKEWSKFLIVMDLVSSCNVNERNFYICLHVNGVRMYPSLYAFSMMTTATYKYQTSASYVVTLPKGTHAIQLYFATQVGGNITTIDQGSMVITEL